MSRKSPNEQYISKIHQVQDYIEDNLDKALTLESLAGIVNLSPFYFHRLFKSHVEESLYSYIQRQRLEKATFLLISDKELSISHIALAVGFSNQASFAKAFKKHYGISATEYRKSKNGKEKNKHGKVKDTKIRYNHNEVDLDDEKRTNFITPKLLEVCNVVDKEVIYVRHIGYYKGNSDLFISLFNKLYKWAFARDLINSDTEWLVLYHSNGDSADDRLRMSVCMTISKPVKGDNEIGKRMIVGGKYAFGRFELSASDYQRAWDYMISGWLPDSGFKPDDRLAYELYPTHAKATEEGKNVVDIYIPIEPL